MFVVDFTPAGFPIGVFVDDGMDGDWNDDDDTTMSQQVAPTNPTPEETEP